MSFGPLVTRVRVRSGMSLVELMIVVAIVGLLAAVAIPTFSIYVKEAGLSEGTANVQGILEAEQAYFVRFQRYTAGLSFCPVARAPQGETQLWAPCSDGWRMLGWSPDGAVSFQYRVFSAFDGLGDYAYAPTDAAGWSQSGPPSPPPGGPDTFGVDWTAEFSAIDPQPWCAVEAAADSDRDDDYVYIRSNSYNHKNYRHPNPDLGAQETY